MNRMGEKQGDCAQTRRAEAQKTAGELGDMEAKAVHRGRSLAGMGVGRKVSSLRCVYGIAPLPGLRAAPFINKEQ